MHLLGRRRAAEGKAA